MLIYNKNSLLRSMSTVSRSWKPRYFDIGVNFSDQMFQGCYNGSTTPKHPADMEKVIDRAHTFNVDRMLITASNIEESEEHFDLVDKHKGYFGSTVGVHPCSVAQEFYVRDEESGESTNQLRPDVDEKLSKLHQLTINGFEKGLVKAFGEIGLDYDRLHYSTKEQQLVMFRKQLEVIAKLKNHEIPLFLHMRSACDDFIATIKPFVERGEIRKGNGVVHSFTGTTEELTKLLDLGFYIGINGCSLRAEENLETVKLIPKEKLMIETDAPWCEIRKSHASYKFITPYPNKYYPEIKLDEPVKKEESNDEVKAEVEDARKPKKQQPKSKLPIVKLDDFLPFPSIKKENFSKHQDAIKVLKESKKIEESVDYTKIGEFAYPLMKSRNEPVFVGYVAEIMCKLYGIEKDEDIENFIDLVYENSCKLFKL